MEQVIVEESNYMDVKANIIAWCVFHFLCYEENENAMRARLLVTFIKQGGS